MTDDEIYDVVVEHLREYPEVDVDGIEVRVKDGRVALAGRVSGDREGQVAEGEVKLPPLNSPGERFRQEGAVHSHFDVRKAIGHPNNYSPDDPSAPRSSPRPGWG
jgi:hypothetical protein